MRTRAAAPSASLEEEAAVMVPFFRSNKVGKDCMASSSILSASGGRGKKRDTLKVKWLVMRNHVFSWSADKGIEGVFVDPGH